MTPSPDRRRCGRGPKPCLFGVAGPDNEHVRNQLKLASRIFGPELFGAIVACHAKTRCGKLLFELAAIGFDLLAHRENTHLLRRQPQRERPAKCSISTPMNRSSEPSGARWIITGLCG